MHPATYSGLPRGTYTSYRRWLPAMGLAIGILYAPHSGKVTRGLIEERVHDARHKADKILEEARDKAEEIIDKAKAKATQMRGGE